MNPNENERPNPENYQPSNPLQPAADVTQPVPPTVAPPQVSPNAYVSPAAPVNDSQMTPNQWPQVSSVTSQQAAQPYPTVAPVQKKSYLGLILGLVGGGIALLLVLFIGIIVAVSVFSVSKSDYQAGSKQLNDAKESYNDMNSVYVSASSSPSEITNSLDTLKDNRQSFNLQFDKLGSMKAVTRDKEVKQAYDAAKAKLTSFNQTIDASIETCEKILPALSNSSSASSSADITALRDKVAAISGLKDENNKIFVANMTSTLTELVPLAQKVEAGRHNYKVYDSAATKAYYETTTKMSTQIRDWQSNRTKQLSDGEINKEMSSLADALLAKSL